MNSEEQQKPGRAPRELSGNAEGVWSWPPQLHGAATGVMFAVGAELANVTHTSCGALTTPQCFGSGAEAPVEFMPTAEAERLSD